MNTLWQRLTCFSNLFLNILTFWRAFVFNNKMSFYKHCNDFRDLVNYPVPCKRFGYLEQFWNALVWTLGNGSNQIPAEVDRSQIYPVPCKRGLKLDWRTTVQLFVFFDFNAMHLYIYCQYFVTGYYSSGYHLCLLLYRNVHEDLPSSLFIQKLGVLEVSDQPRFYALNCDKGQILLQIQQIIYIKIWNS